MSATDLLATLLQENVMLWAEDGELCFQAPKDALNPGLRQELIAHKAEIISLLGERQKYLPASFMQQRLWFLYQLQPTSSAYNIASTVRLTGRLDVPALENSLNEVVWRHEALRTTFTAVDGQAAQVVSSTCIMNLPTVDLRHLGASEQNQHVQQLIKGEAQKPFDLQQGPLMRATLLKLREQEHLLLATMHHIISDGWSMDVLIREVGMLYEAFTRGATSPLPALPLQYPDFTIWQRNWLANGALQEQLTYWKQQLADAPKAVELPIARARPPVQTFSGRQQPFTLSPDLTNGLKTLSRLEGVTLFMTLLAAFKLLLFRYSGEKNIVVGSPVANRDQAEIEGLIGLFVNTLVLNTDLSGNPTFQELLKRVQKMALGAYGHQDLPFERLVEEIQPKRDLSRNPLFQVMFVLQSARLETLKGSGLTLTTMDVDNGAAQVDLTMSVVETEQGLKGALKYNSDLFDAETISRMFSHYQTLLEAVIVNPSAHIEDLPLLDGAETDQLLVEWNATEKAYPQEAFIHELFAVQAQKTPKATAVTFEDQYLTYAELNNRANQLAHYLQRLGVGPNVLVGVCLERSLEMVIALYGILKAGGAYVPLDPTYPRERLAFMVADSQVPILLTQEKLVIMLPEYQGQLICLDADWETIEQEDSNTPQRTIDSGSLAYMIYTSGSTGRPKGAMNTHSGILNRLWWMQDAYQLTANDCVMQKTPFSFDVSVWEFFWPLMFGARLAVMRPEGHKDNSYLVKKIIEENVTTMHFVPSMLQLFLEEKNVEACVSLRQIFCSGEALPYSLQERFFNRLSAELINLYGPTEAAVDVTHWQCQRDSQKHIVPIGRPIANTQIYVLDPNLKPVPIGIPGELYIGGVGLGRGYYRRPLLTAEKFIPNPFSQEPGERLYRSGDLVKYLPDGSIEFLSRIDRQVKVRGFRIELGEIEAALAAHTAVREVVTLVREDEPGDKQIVAYIVSDNEPEASTSNLRRFLAESLPDYMIPSAIVTLEALPLMPNGKIDRGALPAPSTTRPDLEKVYVQPRNELEEQLAQVWAEVLGLEKVGIDDDFFDMGGHSFKAIKITGKFEALEVMDLFKYPTIRQLAEFMMADDKEKDGLLYRLTKSTGPNPVSIVCIPFGGGSAIAYRPLSVSLPDNYNVYAVGIPGHEFGKHDEELKPIEEVAELCVAEIQQKVAGPVVLYGHCLGVALTVEIARLLQETGSNDVEAIFLGASFPFRTKRPFMLKLYKGAIRYFPNKWLQNFLNSLGGFEEVMDATEFAFIARNFWHDFQFTMAYFTYAFREGGNRKLNAPILFIAGEKDNLTKGYAERYREWELFSDSVELATISGGHYFIKHQAEDTAQIIIEYLRQARHESKPLAREMEPVLEVMR